MHTYSHSCIHTHCHMTFETIFRIFLSEIGTNSSTKIVRLEDEYNHDNTVIITITISSSSSSRPLF